ncbi:MAG TPA: hypothetical protein VET86_00250 [Casimicrobiaceae bacterium]|nr:hypothetical protein [Casimicrobiaceae bacterium]
MKHSLLPVAVAVERRSRATVFAAPSVVATPGGAAPVAHGFLHAGEDGDCSSSDGMSAGWHKTS